MLSAGSSSPNLLSKIGQASYIGLFNAVYLDLRIEDGRMINKTSTERDVFLNDTEGTLSRMAILAVANSPNPNIQFMLSLMGLAGDTSLVSSSK